MSFNKFVKDFQYLLSLSSYTVLFKSTFVDEKLLAFSNDYEMPEDYVRMVVVLMLSFPLSWIQTFIHSPRVKKVFSIVCGVFLLQFCFKGEWIHSLVSSTIVYAIILFANPKRMPYYVFYASLGYLSASSLFYMLTNYMSYSLDSTTYQMMHIARFQMLAWSIYDGTTDYENVEEGAKKNDRMSHVYKRRQEEYIREVPSPLEFYAYVYHFPGIMGGPTIYFREFHDMINNLRYPEGIPSSRYLPAFKTLLKGVFFLVLYGVCTMYMSIDDLISSKYDDQNLLVRLGIMYVAILGFRSRYHGMWKVNEFLCIMNGFGEEVSKTGEHDWNGISNVDILAFETSGSFQETTKLWNKRIQKWLQMCIYERYNFNQFYVFMVSAFWHGFYPSYYCAFMFASLMSAVNRLAHKKLYPYVKGTVLEKPYNLCGLVFCCLARTFMQSAFSCYTLYRSLEIWSKVDYFMPLLLVVAYAILSFVPTKKEKEL